MDKLWCKTLLVRAVWITVLEVLVQSLLLLPFSHKVADFVELPRVFELVVLALIHV